MLQNSITANWIIVTFTIFAWMMKTVARCWRANAGVFHNTFTGDQVRLCLSLGQCWLLCSSRCEITPRLINRFHPIILVSKPPLN